MSMSMEMKNEQKLISVIMLTRNRAKFLPRAFESIFAQSYKNWELIVVNDGSGDETATILSAHADKNERIKVFNNQWEEQGLPGARRLGVRCAQGSYIAFHDDDDVWPTNHLEQLAAYLDGNIDIDWVFGDMERRLTDGTVVVRSVIAEELDDLKAIPIEQRGELNVFKTDGLLTRALKRRLVINYQCSLYRRRVFELIAIRDTDLEDQMFTFEAIARGVRIGFVRECHVFFTVHRDNFSAVRRVAEPLKLSEDLEINRRVEDLWGRCVHMYLNLDEAQVDIARKNLASYYVWDLGHGVYRARGMRSHTLKSILRGLRVWPWETRYWKTLFATLLQFGRGEAWQDQ